MVTALNLIGSSDPLQGHWARRFLAILIDGVLFSVVYWVLWAVLLSAVFAFGGFGLGFFGLGALIAGALWLGYAWIMDWLAGGTIGKKVLGLRVTRMDGGPPGPVEALVRNVSKVHWVLLAIDFLAGFVTDGDPRQKFSDRVMKGTVTRTDQSAYMEEQFRQMGQTGALTPPVFGAPSPAAQPAANPLTAPGAAPATAAAASPSTPPPSSEGWPPQEPKSDWPKHDWDESGRLRPQGGTCSQCGGNLVPRGDGKMTCVRCGAVY